MFQTKKNHITVVLLILTLTVFIGSFVWAENIGARKNVELTVYNQDFTLVK